MRQNNENRRSSSRWNDESRERDRGRNRQENDYGSQRSFRSNYDDEGDDYRSGRYGSSGNYENRGQSGIGNESYQGGYDRGDNFGGRYGSSGLGNQYSQGSYGQNRWNEDYNNDRGFGNTGGYGNMSGNYGDRDYDRNYGNMGSAGSNYGQSNRNFGSNPSNRDWNSNQGYYGQGNSNYGRQDRGYDQQNERGWWDRTRDEMSSWFGDDDAERRRRMDKMEGSHRGKGPKDYQRSEERIREDVSDRLSDDHSVDASNIEIKVSGSDVILSGTVETRQEKRRAEDIAESVSGVSNVQNQLRVGQGSEGSTASMSKSKTGTTTGNNLKTEKAHHN